MATNHSCSQAPSRRSCQKTEEARRRRRPPGRAAAPAAPRPPTPSLKVACCIAVGTMASANVGRSGVMTFDEINAAGGILGRKIGVVVPGVEWPLFRQKARDLIQNQKVAGSSGAGHRCPGSRCCGLRGVTGSCSSVQYEARSRRQCSKGRRANQRPSGRSHTSGKKGGAAKRGCCWAMIKCIPAPPHKILRTSCTRRRSPTGHHGEVHAVRSQRLQTIVADVKSSPQGSGPGVRPSTAIRSSLLQGARQPGIEGTDIPVVAFSSARRNFAASTPSRWSATWRPGTTSCRSTRPRTRPSSTSGWRS